MSRMSDDAPDVPAFYYANVLQAHFQAFDVILDFGLKAPAVSGPDDEAAEVIEPQVRLAMSHAHAKSMLPILARLIDAFEEGVGTIATTGFEDKS